MKVFLDMDGVLADFDGWLASHGIRNITHHIHRPKETWTEEEKEIDKIVVDQMSQPGFFRNLPLMTNAHELWLTAGDPFVLTARPKYREGSLKEELPDFGDRVANEKLSWLRDYFDIKNNRFVCCLREQKVLYAKEDIGMPNILVDDLLVNCQEWEAQGGVAVLFRNMDQAVKDLRKAMKVVNG